MSLTLLSHEAVSAVGPQPNFDVCFACERLSEQSRGRAATVACFQRQQHPWTSRQVLPGGGDFGGDEQRRAGVGARAARASTTDSPRLFECSERSERSEFCGATPDRAAQ